MQLIDFELPLPFLKANKAGQIISYSSQAEEIFDLSQGVLLSLIDEGSIKKFENAPAIAGKNMCFEANLKTKTSQITLFDVYITWDHEHNAYMQFAVKEKDNERLFEKLQELQNRLAATDFELYEKKEMLERTLLRLDELSGPFIPLSNSIAYIPLFGDITQEKISIISERCYHAVSNGEYSLNLIDVTSVGYIYDDGVLKLKEMIKGLRLITGGEVKLIGMSPKLTPIFHKYNFESIVETNHSLAKVLNMSVS
ncbi:STAS domain-containing protein [Cytobacillus horneckiae]|uniref:STAS domain-containing protein n=1 Tax=Cytobacillus horneckiae TaxID=549687 RepID=UPI003D1D86D1